jgi:hypothetical protein
LIVQVNELFIIEEINGKYALKSCYGTYLTAHPNGAIEGNPVQILDWEKFSINILPDLVEGSSYSFVCFHGKHLSAKPDGNLRFDCDFAGDWERFKIIKTQNNRFCFKTFHETYITVSPNGNVSATDTDINDNTLFTIEIANGKYALKNFHGTYLSAQPNGKVEGNRVEAFEWESFSINKY